MYVSCSREMIKPPAVTGGVSFVVTGSAQNPAGLMRSASTEPACRPLVPAKASGSERVEEKHSRDQVPSCPGRPIPSVLRRKPERVDDSANSNIGGTTSFPRPSRQVSLSAADAGSSKPSVQSPQHCLPSMKYHRCLSADPRMDPSPIRTPSKSFTSKHRDMAVVELPEERRSARPQSAGGIQPLPPPRPSRLIQRGIPPKMPKRLDFDGEEMDRISSNEAFKCSKRESGSYTREDYCRPGSESTGYMSPGSVSSPDVFSDGMSPATLHSPSSPQYPEAHLIIDVYEPMDKRYFGLNFKSRLVKSSYDLRNSSTYSLPESRATERLSDIGLRTRDASGPPLDTVDQANRGRSHSRKAQLYDVDQRDRTVPDRLSDDLKSSRVSYEEGVIYRPRDRSESRTRSKSLTRQLCITKTITTEEELIIIPRAASVDVRREARGRKKQSKKKRMRQTSAPPDKVLEPYTPAPTDVVFEVVDLPILKSSAFKAKELKKENKSVTLETSKKGDNARESMVFDIRKQSKNDLMKPAESVALADEGGLIANTDILKEETVEINVIHTNGNLTGVPKAQLSKSNSSSHNVLYQQVADFKSQPATHSVLINTCKEPTKNQTSAVRYPGNLGLNKSQPLPITCPEPVHAKNSAAMYCNTDQPDGADKLSGDCESRSSKIKVTSSNAPLRMATHKFYTDSRERLNVEHQLPSQSTPVTTAINYPLRGKSTQNRISFQENSAIKSTSVEINLDDDFAIQKVYSPKVQKFEHDLSSNSKNKTSQDAPEAEINSKQKGPSTSNLYGNLQRSTSKENKKLTDRCMSAKKEDEISNLTLIKTSEKSQQPLSNTTSRYAGSCVSELNFLPPCNITARSKSEIISPMSEVNTDFIINQAFAHLSEDEFSTTSEYMEDLNVSYSSRTTENLEQAASGGAQFNIKSAKQELEALKEGEKVDVRRQINLWETLVARDNQNLEGAMPIFKSPVNSLTIRNKWNKRSLFHSAQNSPCKLTSGASASLSQTSSHQEALKRSETVPVSKELASISTSNVKSVENQGSDRSSVKPPEQATGTNLCENRESKSCYYYTEGIQPDIDSSISDVNVVHPFGIDEFVRFNMSEHNAAISKIYEYPNTKSSQDLHSHKTATLESHYRVDEVAEKMISNDIKKLNTQSFQFKERKTEPEVKQISIVKPSLQALSPQIDSSNLDTSDHVDTANLFTRSNEDILSTPVFVAIRAASSYSNSTAACSTVPGTNVFDEQSGDCTRYATNIAHTFKAISKDNVAILTQQPINSDIAKREAVIDCEAIVMSKSPSTGDSKIGMRGTASTSDNVSNSLTIQTSQADRTPHCAHNFVSVMTGLDVEFLGDDAGDDEVFSTGTQPEPHTFTSCLVVQGSSDILIDSTKQHLQATNPVEEREGGNVANYVNSIKIIPKANNADISGLDSVRVYNEKNFTARLPDSILADDGISQIEPISSHAQYHLPSASSHTDIYTPQIRKISDAVPDVGMMMLQVNSSSSLVSEVEQLQLETPQSVQAENMASSPLYAVNARPDLAYLHMDAKPQTSASIEELTAHPVAADLRQEPEYITADGAVYVSSVCEEQIVKEVREKKVSSVIESDKDKHVEAESSKGESIEFKREKEDLSTKTEMFVEYFISPEATAVQKEVIETDPVRGIEEEVGIICEDIREDISTETQTHTMTEIKTSSGVTLDENRNITGVVISDVEKLCQRNELGRRLADIPSGWQVTSGGAVDYCGEQPCYALSCVGITDDPSFDDKLVEEHASGIVQQQLYPIENAIEIQRIDWQKICSVRTNLDNLQSMISHTSEEVLNERVGTDGVPAIRDCRIDSSVQHELHDKLNTDLKLSSLAACIGTSEVKHDDFYNNDNNYDAFEYDFNDGDSSRGSIMNARNDGVTDAAVNYPKDVRTICASNDTMTPTSNHAGEEEGHVTVSATLEKEGHVEVEGSKAVSAMLKQESQVDIEGVEAVSTTLEQESQVDVEWGEAVSATLDQESQVDVEGGEAVSATLEQESQVEVEGGEAESNKIKSHKIHTDTAPDQLKLNSTDSLIADYLSNSHLIVDNQASGEILTSVINNDRSDQRYIDGVTYIRPTENTSTGGVTSRRLIHSTRRDQDVVLHEYSEMISIFRAMPTSVIKILCKTNNSNHSSDDANSTSLSSQRNNDTMPTCLASFGSTGDLNIHQTLSAHADRLNQKEEERRSIGSILDSDVRDDIISRHNNSETIRRLLSRYPSLRPGSWSWVVESVTTREDPGGSGGRRQSGVVRNQGGCECKEVIGVTMVDVTGVTEKFKIENST